MPIPEFSHFRLMSVQAAVFTPDFQFSVARALQTLLSGLPQFDADPITIPVPADAPREIPRIILRSASEERVFQVAPSRSDFIWRRRQAGAEDQADLQKLLEEGVDCLAIIARDSSRVSRLAVLSAHYCPLPDAPTVLAERFISQDWRSSVFAGLNNFELHTHRIEELGGDLRANRWIRCKTVLREGQRGLSVEHDVNTVAELAEQAAFSEEEIRDFCRKAANIIMESGRALFDGE